MVLPCRQYCARRLRSLYKALKFLHGKGRYTKKKLDVPQVSDARWAEQRGDRQQTRLAEQQRVLRACGLFLWEGHHVHVCEVYCHGVLGQCEVTTINGGERQQQLLQEA